MSATLTHASPGRPWAEIAGALLKLGSVGYGGPALMGLLQRELQEKRGWVSKEQFLEDLAVVNMLPGPRAHMLAIFLGCHRAGAWGGILAGLCFMLPAFLILIALSVLYDTYGDLPAMRHAFYGVGPVVVAIFAVAVWRLCKPALTGWPEISIAVIAAALSAYTPLGIVGTLALAGAVGVALHHSRSRGLWACTIVLVLALASQGLSLLPAAPGGAGGSAPGMPGLWELSAFFFKVGACTFGGGLAVLAFLQQHVVGLGWLTSQEYIDGLAIGQLTPGPIIMVAAYVGYKLHGIIGALAAGFAIFLPSFVISVAVFGVLQRFRRLSWVKAALRGLAAAIIGVISIALLPMAVHAVPDLFTGILLLTATALLLYSSTGSVTLMLGGAAAALLARMVLA
jgi:chromate transporter